MALDMWFKEDIRNVLLSLNLVSAATSRWVQDARLDAYRHGYEEAIAAVALAFGLPPRSVLGKDREQGSEYDVSWDLKLLP